MADDGRVITGRPVTVAAACADEHRRCCRCLQSRPARPGCCRARVDGRARVCLRQNYYSVPAC